MAVFNSLFYFPEEGLTYMMNIIPRNVQAPPALTYLGLSATPWSTISGWIAGSNNTNINLNSTTYNGGQNAVLEASGLSGYTRLTLSGANWPAVTSGTITIGTSTGIAITQSTNNQTLTWTNTGATYSTINGIFVATTGTVGFPSSGQSSVVLWYAPFSDLSTVTLASGDSLTVTPTWQSASYPY